MDVCLEGNDVGNGCLGMCNTNRSGAQRGGTYFLVIYHMREAVRSGAHYVLYTRVSSTEYGCPNQISFAQSGSKWCLGRVCVCMHRGGAFRCAAPSHYTISVAWASLHGYTFERQRHQFPENN